MANELSMDEAFIKKLTDILEANLENEQFGVEELADAIGLSRSQLFRKLNSITGKSVSQYIREYRLEKAMAMLQNNVATASEIAYRVGFGSPTYFNTSFHNYYGFPPGEAKLRVKAVEKIPNEESSNSGNFSETIQPKPFKTRTFFIISLGAVLLMSLLYYLFIASNSVSKNQPSEEIVIDKSIALLPFKSLTKDEESKYLAEGIMASIQNHLNPIPNLRVISAKTMEQFKESPKSAQQIAQEVNVSFLLAASVQRYDDKVRIIVQLIDGRNDEQIWSKDYERDFKDIFILESDISKRIANELELVISPLKQKEIEKMPTNSVEAYNLYVKGNYFKSKGGNENYDIGLRYFKQAIDLDPEFALAYSGLSRSMLLRFVFFDFPDKKQIDSIKELSIKAIELDSTIAEAHDVLATLESVYNWNWEKAEREFKISIKLNPNYADSYFSYANFLYNVKGDFVESRKYLNQALILNPLSYSFYAKSAEFYIDEGDYLNAFQETKKAKEIDNKNLWAYWIDFENFVAQSNYDMATEELVESWNMDPGNIENAKAIKVAYEKSGIKGVYRWINDLDIKNGQDLEYPYWVAQKFAFLGDKEKALDYLEHTYEISHVSLYPVKYDKYFKDLRSEPRFLALLRKMKLGGYNQ